MNQEKVGKLILSLRHKYGMTQQELADKLNITAKAISKWECGIGLPDITMLTDLSKIFNITIDELLNGELKETNISKNKKHLITISIIIITIILIIIIHFLHIKENKKIIPNCTIIRTYYIDNIGKSNDDNYLYLTIHEYQVEGTYTIKLSKLIGANLEVGSSYEFVFKTADKYLNTTTDDLFANSEIINLNYSDKVGNERVSKFYCDKEEHK